MNVARKRQNASMATESNGVPHLGGHACCRKEDGSYVGPGYPTPLVLATASPIHLYLVLYGDDIATSCMCGRLMTQLPHPHRNRSDASAPEWHC